MGRCWVGIVLGGSLVTVINTVLGRMGLSIIALIDVLGGPEIYNVARRALTAGLPGKRIEKILEVKLVVSGILARLCSLRDSTRGHFCD